MTPSKHLFQHYSRIIDSPLFVIEMKAVFMTFDSLAKRAKKENYCLWALAKHMGLKKCKVSVNIRGAVVLISVYMT